MNLLAKGNKILVIGGTRLLGLSVVKRLVYSGFNVTVISRRSDKKLAGVTYVVAERLEGLRKISSINFDVVFDFLAYDSRSVKESLQYTNDAAYIYVSSIWLSRLSEEEVADAWIDTIDQKRLLQFLPVTQKYLTGKHEGEKVLLEHKNRGRNVIILRLPIFLGENDHTARITFYSERMLDGAPLLLIDRRIESHSNCMG